MEIKQNITSVNRTAGNNRAIDYLVIHYVGAVSSAYNNTIYFKSINRGASAHFFADEDSIWQCVLEKDIAWHCGSETGFYKHPACRNSNSIGIELCCKQDPSGGWYFERQTVENGLWLAAGLAAAYRIPAANILRHFDVTGKICPEPWVREERVWNDFKERVVLAMQNVPEWQKNAFYRLVNDEIIASPEYWEKDLSEPITKGEVMGLVWALYQNIKEEKQHVG